MIHCKNQGVLSTTIAVAFLCAVAPAALAQNWVHPDWAHRIEITADAASIEGSGDHVDFPLLVPLSAAQATVFAKAKADGSDILFTAADGTTVLAHERVGYDAGSQSAEFWVRMPALSKTQNRLYLYYANPDTTIDAVSAWSEDYRVVYHFDNDPADGILRDASGRDAHAIAPASRGWVSGDRMPGKIGDAWMYDGLRHTYSNSISTPDSCYTMSAWLSHTAVSVDFFMQANPGFWHTSSAVNSDVSRADYASEGRFMRWDPNPIAIDGTFHHFAWSFDGVGDTIVFYYDGEPQRLGINFSPNGGPVYRGLPINPNQAEPVGVLGPMFFNLDDRHDGLGDEFRLRDGAASAEWILTEYRSQADPASFLSFGAEEIPVAVERRSLGRLRARF